MLHKLKLVSTFPPWVWGRILPFIDSPVYWTLSFTFVVCFYFLCIYAVLGNVLHHPIIHSIRYHHQHLAWLSFFCLLLGLFLLSLLWCVLENTVWCSELIRFNLYIAFWKVKGTPSCCFLFRFLKFLSLCTDERLLNFIFIFIIIIFVITSWKIV